MGHTMHPTQRIRELFCKALMLKFLKRKREEGDIETKNKKRKFGSKHSYDGTLEYKIICWNVNGLKSIIEDSTEKLNPLRKVIEEEEPTYVCLQETKLSSTDTNTLSYKYIFRGYEGYFHHCKRKKGYSGVCTYVKLSEDRKVRAFRKINHEKCDNEGRLIGLKITETGKNKTKFLLNTYVPNSGRDLGRLSYRVNIWDENYFRFMRTLLEKNKSTKTEMVWCGDLNCTHNLVKDIHLAPEQTEKIPGCTKEERGPFLNFLKETKMFDSFEFLNPFLGRKDRYTHYSYQNREMNIRKQRGWRLDYFILSENLKEKVRSSYVISDQTFGSDHLPIGLILKY